MLLRILIMSKENHSLTLFFFMKQLKNRNVVLCISGCAKPRGWLSFLQVLRNLMCSIDTQDPGGALIRKRIPTHPSIDHSCPNPDLLLLYKDQTKGGHTVNPCQGARQAFNLVEVSHIR